MKVSFESKVPFRQNSSHLVLSKCPIKSKLEQHYQDWTIPNLSCFLH